MKRANSALFLLLASLTLTSHASTALWQPMAASETRLRDRQADELDRVYRSHPQQLHQLLSRSHQQGQADSTAEIQLPLANGEVQSFSLNESPMMAQGLAQRYPGIRTYKVEGIDNPYASGRLSLTDKGFHGMITSPAGTQYIDQQEGDSVRVYRRQAQKSAQSFNCGVEGHSHDRPLGSFSSRASARSPGNLRVYRLAVSATAEYTNVVGGSVSDAMSEIVIAINRVNQIYERDLGIRLQLVDNNDALVFLGDTSADPFSNYDGLTMLAENQVLIDSVIGTMDYDVGHVFSTGGGGIAQVGAVCNSNLKAQGVTGLTNPTTETFYIDYVAHELGHQFGADHSFNGSTSSCSGGNRWQPTAYEPGSGSSIMSYAGICGLEDVQPHTDALFHAGSIAVIDDYVANGGSSCGSLLSVDNANEPTADAGSNFTIPAMTPFVLTGSGNDSDSDTLSYSWDQMDTGTATDVTTYGTDLGDNALMRSRLPQAESSRSFPRLDTLLAGTIDKAETLPATNRILNFRLGVRDGKTGFAFDDLVLSVDASSGPFEVTSHAGNMNLTGNTSETVNWEVAGTSSAPVNCSGVDIDLLMMNSSKTSYCEYSLADNVANNGGAVVVLPDLTIPQARIRVSCADNIFYAISSGDLVVTGNQVASTDCATVIPGNEEHDDVNLVVDGTDSSGSSGDSGSVDFSWLLLLSLFYLGRVAVNKKSKTSL